MTRLEKSAGPIAPSEDLSLFSYPATDGSIVIWEKGHEKSRLKAHFSNVQAVAFSPDNRLLAVTAGDAVAQIWSLRTGRPVTDPLVGHLSAIHKLAFSADSRTLMTYCADQTARLWNVATGREVMSALPLNHLLFSHPAIHILSDDGNAMIEPDGEERLRVLLLPAFAKIDAAENSNRQNPLAEDATRAQAIRRWLVLAPIEYTRGQSGKIALDQQQIPNESKLRPKAGARVRIGPRELAWRAVSLKTDVLDFAGGQQLDYCVGYAVCYLRADTAKRGLVMKIGSDDQSKVYLNGQQIYRYPANRSFVADQNTVHNVDLRAGLNVLIFKVVNETLDWKGALRLTEADGKPVQGVEVTLKPEFL